MWCFSQIMPDHELLLSLEPEELAVVVLQYFNLPGMNVQLNRDSFGMPHTVKEYPRELQKKIREVLMEAWMWLEHQRLVIPKPGGYDQYYIITAKGKELRDSTDLEVYRKANLLPQQLLHSSIAEDVWSNFLRDKYDTAILEAFKEVEVAVRNAGGYTEADYGVDMMRKAFHADNGPLRDQNQLKPEREATAHLFAGAIGRYKNPSSHRNVPVTAEEAVEIIMFASHLLRIVDSRTPTSNAV